VNHCPEVDHFFILQIEVHVKILIPEVRKRVQRNEVEEDDDEHEPNVPDSLPPVNCTVILIKTFSWSKMAKVWELSKNIPRSVPESLLPAISLVF